MKKTIFLQIALATAGTFFLVSLASFAIAKDIPVRTEGLKGSIVAVNSYAGTVSVKSTGAAEAYTFSVNRQTDITACAQNKTFDTLGVGEEVIVAYQRQNSGLIADAIGIQGSDPATCYIY